MLSRALIALLLASLPCATWAGPDPVDLADAAFDAGDYPRALELYEQVISGQPENLHAMFRSALLLSWENRLPEALDRYDRLLAIEPVHRRARFERAKVLSWDGRLDAAATAFRDILEDRPDDVEVRVAYARCLAWNEDYVTARAEYERVLRDHPGHLNAMIGMAQAYAWASRLKTARTWYERALIVDPESKDAAVGLASLDLWSGNPGSAGVRAEELADRFPDDGDVRALRERTRKALATWVRTFAESTEDTDDNRLDVYGAQVGWGVRAGPSLSLGYTRFDMQDPSRRGSIDSLFGTIGFVPAQGQRLIVRAGVDKREDSTGETATDTVGSAHYTWGLDRRLQLGVVAGRDALRYSPAITDNGILIDEYSTYFALRAGSRWRVNGSAGQADLSDGNRRRHLWSGFRFRFPISGPRLEGGLRYRYMDFEQDLDNAYFDPAGFRAWLAQLRVGGKFGKNENTYSVSVETGLQSFTLNGNSIDDDQVLMVAGTLGIPLARTFVLELTANRGDYAAQTATGYESRFIGLRLRWNGASRERRN